MHYANGRAAKVGDLVRGKGYNVKHEITGILVGAQPGATTCNCTVAHVGPGCLFKVVGWLNSGGGFAFPNSEGNLHVGEVTAATEYGQLDAFVALDPNTGEVLPPE